MKEYWLDPVQYSNPICPICFDECETIYKDGEGNVCGCENCISAVDAYEWAEEQEAEHVASYGDYQFEAEREKRFERSIDG